MTTIHKRENASYAVCGELINIDLYRFLYTTEDDAEVTCRECIEAITQKGN